MKPGVFAVAALATIGSVPCTVQFPGAPTGARINIPGTLELVDKPLSVTPVEFLMVTIRHLQDRHQIHAQPDHDGKFTLENVPPDGILSIFLLLVGFRRSQLGQDR